MSASCTTRNADTCNAADGVGGAVGIVLAEPGNFWGNTVPSAATFFIPWVGWILSWILYWKLIEWLFELDGIEPIVLSIVFWTGVIFAGRWTAYNL